MKSLPLPLNAIKEIKDLINENSRNLWVVNPLKNVLVDLCNYDYSDAVKGLEFLKSDFPDLMDYNKNIGSIKKAEKRYNNI